jgi:hypothetical protein
VSQAVKLPRRLLAESEECQHGEDDDNESARMARNIEGRARRTDAGHHRGNAGSGATPSTSTGGVCATLSTIDTKEK